MLTSFDDAKKIVTLKNFFNECYRFNMRCMHPAVVPVHYALLYMIQSGTYILSPDFISTYKKISLDEALVLWKMAHTPSETKLNDVLTVLFNPLSYGRKVRNTISAVHFVPLIIEFCFYQVSQRYFVAGVHRLDMEEHNRVVSDPSPSSSSSTGPMTRVNALLSIARSRAIPPSAAVTTQPDYLPLPDDDADENASFYTMDTSPANIPSADTSRLLQECPGNLEEMLALVRDLRRDRMDNLMLQRERDGPVVTPATEDRRAAKEANIYNYTVTNLADMYDVEL
jgi:hypothetical protein